MMDYREACLTPEHQALRATDLISFDEAAARLGRDLTDAEEWAVWDNKQDYIMVEMGR